MPPSICTRSRFAATRRTRTPLFGLAEARYRQGRFDEAIEPVAARMPWPATKSSRRSSSTARGENGYRQIDKTWVRVQLEALKERKTTGYVSPLDFARVHAQLDERNRHFKYLDAAFADRSPGLVFLNVDRAWDSVRDDPRFVAAVKNLGLPEPPVRPDS